MGINVPAKNNTYLYSSVKITEDIITACLRDDIIDVIMEKLIFSVINNNIGICNRAFFT